MYKEDELVEGINKVFAKQFFRLAVVRKSFGHCSDGASKIQTALLLSKRAVECHVGQVIEKDSLNPLLVAVARSVAVYQSKYHDSMDYGRTTFKTILEDLLELQRKHGERTVYSIDQLMDLESSSVNIQDEHLA